MIIEEILPENLIKHYSDKNLKIIQIETGLIYLDAIDSMPCKYTYIESDIPIETYDDYEEEWEEEEE